MARPVYYRVRVRRATETWVEVAALSTENAEDEALKVPGVLSVFGKSAIRVDETNRPGRPEGVRDE